MSQLRAGDTRQIQHQAPSVRHWLTCDARRSGKGRIRFELCRGASDATRSRWFGARFDDMPMSSRLLPMILFPDDERRAGVHPPDMTSRDRFRVRGVFVESSRDDADIDSHSPGHTHTPAGPSPSPSGTRGETNNCDDTIPPLQGGGRTQQYAIKKREQLTFMRQQKISANSPKHAQGKNRSSRDEEKGRRVRGEKWERWREVRKVAREA